MAAEEPDERRPRDGRASGKTAVLCFGDSLTAGRVAGPSLFMPKCHHPYAKRLRALLGAEYEVVEAGCSGEKTGDMLQRLRATLEPSQTQFQVVCLLGGTNDLGGRLGHAEIVDNLREMYLAAAKHGAVTLAISVPEALINVPHYIEKRKAVNDGIRKVVKEWNQPQAIAFLDLEAQIPYLSAAEDARAEMWSDSLHMTEKGYDRFGELVFNEVQRIIS